MTCDIIVIFAYRPSKRLLSLYEHTVGLSVGSNSFKDQHGRAVVGETICAQYAWLSGFPVVSRMCPLVTHLIFVA